MDERGVSVNTISIVSPMMRASSTLCSRSYRLAHEGALCTCTSGLHRLAHVGALSQARARRDSVGGYHTVKGLIVI